MPEPADIEFCVTICRSMRPGQYTISLMNSQDDSIVIGHTSDPEKSKQTLSRTLNSSEWQTNNTIDYHSLTIRAGKNGRNA